MARFRYTAKSMDGKTKRGTMEALTENAMIQELKSQGLFLVEAKNLTEAKGYGACTGYYLRSGGNRPERT